MIITSLEDSSYKRNNKKNPSSRSKFKVFLDGTYAFPLYQGDIRSLELEEGMDITDSIYDQILKLIVLPRAKKKAMDLLQLQDRSEFELIHKLKDQLYPESIIQDTITYIKGYGYINDERYATSYIKSRMHQKSRKIIQMELKQKGIDSHLLEILFEDIYCEIEEDPEMDTLKRLVEKMHIDIPSLTPQEKQKVIAKLYRKGFDFDKIKKVLSIS